MAKFKFYQSDPNFLIPQRVGDLIPEDDISWIILEIVDRLDVSKIINKYSDKGCDGFHPALLLKIIFYGVATGHRSSRKIARLAQKDLAGIMLCGGEKPSWRTVARFLKTNEVEVKGLFLQVLKICISLNMVSFGHFSLDGTKIKANADKNNSLTIEKIEKKITKLETEIAEAINQVKTNDLADNQQYGESTADELPKEIASKTKRLERLNQAIAELKVKAETKEKTSEVIERYNFTDPESGLMKTSHDGFQQCYNHQLVVDSQERVIISYTTSQKTNDREQLDPALEEALNNINRYPDKLTADAGYFSRKNLVSLDDKPIDAYICPDQTIGAFHKDKFMYDSQNDFYICPDGRRLIYRSTRKKNKNSTVRLYWGDCSGCKHSSKCIKSKTGRRQIERDVVFDSLRQKMRCKFETEDAKEIFSLRKEIIEPVFGQIKQQQSFHQHLRRGLSSTNSEFGLVCLVYNIKRIWHKYESFQGVKVALLKL